MLMKNGPNASEPVPCLQMRKAPWGERITASQHWVLDRVGSRSSILTSQLPIEHWHEYLNDPTLADAIMDRLVHRSHKIHLQGKESMRKRTGIGKDGAKD